eukprot:635966-Rhodomonas_salina.1
MDVSHAPCPPKRPVQAGGIVVFNIIMRSPRARLQHCMFPFAPISVDVCHSSAIPHILQPLTCRRPPSRCGVPSGGFNHRQVPLTHPKVAPSTEPNAHTGTTSDSFEQRQANRHCARFEQRLTLGGTDRRFSRS